MQRIESPTSREHLGRLLFFLVACIGLGSYFLYDGYIGWPRANVPKLVEDFRPVPSEAEIEALKHKIRGDITSASKSEISPTDALSTVRDKLGEPAHEDKEGEGAWYYLGRGGMLTVRHKDDTVTAVEWKDGSHLERDLQTQTLFAAICGVAALITLVALVRALRIKTVVSDEGLSPAPGRLIPWDAMQGLDTATYKPKGWVILTHDEGGGKVETRLDSYRIRDFRAVMGALCERKGFASPFEAPPRVEDTPEPVQHDDDSDSE